MKFSSETGALFINPCPGPELLAGQGTVALEVLEDCQGLRNFVLGVGGAGLLGGCAAVLGTLEPRVKIIGVQSENTAAMARSLAAGRRVEIEDRPTIAEGLAGQIDDDGFETGRAALDQMILVTEENIGRAILWLLDNEGVRAEGAGAAGVAAILSRRLRPAGKTVVVVSGGNIDDERLAAIRAGAASRD
jgi:threonine dehydratase